MSENEERGKEGFFGAVARMLHVYQLHQVEREEETGRSLPFYFHTRPIKRLAQVKKGRKQVAA